MLTTVRNSDDAYFNEGIYGYGKPKIGDAQQAYVERHSPCNDGWCQDIIQAAMLNMTNEAASQLVARAAASNHGGYRFEGFAGYGMPIDEEMMIE